MNYKTYVQKLRDKPLQNGEIKVSLDDIEIFKPLRVENDIQLALIKFKNFPYKYGMKSNEELIYVLDFDESLMMPSVFACPNYKQLFNKIENFNTNDNN